MLSRLGGIGLNDRTECRALIIESRAVPCSGLMFSNTVFSFYEQQIKYPDQLSGWYYIFLTGCLKTDVWDVYRFSDRFFKLNLATDFDSRAL